MFFYSKKKSIPIIEDHLPERKNVMGLPDIDPEVQGGSFSVKYDEVLDQISHEKGVPFALLKAHAIRESSLNSAAFRQEPNGKASYGLMQILWWKNSNRFVNFGYSDDTIGNESNLYDPYLNVSIAASLILENWDRFNENLRDTINAYNTGVSEAKRVAPYNYVDDVIKYYKTLIGKDSIL